jgi:hypothetical protein
VLGYIQRIVSVTKNVINLQLQAPIGFWVGQEKPHETAQCRGRRVRRRDDCDDSVPGGAFERRFNLFEASFVCLEPNERPSAGMYI